MEWSTLAVYASAACLVLLLLRSLRSTLANAAEARLRKMARDEALTLAQNPRPFTTHELRAYDGADLARPLLLAIKGVVLDVSAGRDFYGPSGPYALMAGKDASKAFAMMSLKPEDAHADLSGVDEAHLKILDDWFDKLSKKYPNVGTVQC